jgi:Uma2 family endonuclease
MGMPATAHPWTADEVRALPDDGNRYELISGELVVTPSPRGVHQVTVFELSMRIHSLLERTGGAHILASPADISLGEDEVLQPDLFVYRTANGRHLRNWNDISELVLVIEVLSPSTARYDRQLKRRRYQRARVPEYWIVDIDSRLVERWRPDDERPEILEERLTWQPVPGAEVLDLDLKALFAEMWGDDRSIH